MKKRAIRKDFYMEIRKSLGRFLSIFFIVAMGVAFFSGIRASEPDMRYSGDAYFDRKKLMDVRVIGTLGLTDKDVNALEKVKGVEKVEPGYSTDVLVEVKGNQKVVHTMSILDTMNQYTVEEGRMPEKSGECLVDQDFLTASGLKIGDSIKFFSGTKDSIKDTLKTDVFKIVGSGSSPLYIAFGRGSSTIGNGEVEGFLAVLPQDFALDVYTECYVSVKGAKELTAFTKEYDSKVAAVLKNIEAIEAVQGKRRADEIRDKANAELADAKKKLEDAQKEADEKLADAEKKIEDGERELQDGKQKIIDAKADLENGKNKLYTSQKEVDAAKAKISKGWTELEAGKRELAEKEAEFNQQYEAGMEKLNTAWEELRARLGNYEVSEEERQEMKNNLEKLLEELDNDTIPEEEREKIREQINNLWDRIEQSEANNEIPNFDIAGGDINEIKNTLAKALNALDALEPGTIPENVRQEIRGQIIMAQCMIEQLEAGKAALEEAKAKLSQSEWELMNAQKQADAGQKKINDGWIEIRSGEKEIADGEAEISENEKKLADARIEYEDAKAEAEKKLKDARNEIKDAEREIAKIENAEWYIDDRSSVTDYAGYGDNADRMRAIGEVFPILFFIVAALISLTTMTRMVEEQRTQIGTLKALGYGKFSIAGKYLNYALLATIGGSIFGVLIGEKIFPYVIVTAYKIMYMHLPDVVIPYDWGYAAMATGAAVVCTGIAALFACYKELASQPAVLMRPPAPKQGKRVFLERLTFIWKRLGFIWKSTIRNLVRYKKRFFMTVFGIGGCMSLMIVGFGIRDSIFSIGKLQYEELQLYDGMVILDEGADKEDRGDLEKYLDSEDKIASVSEGYLKKINIKKEKTEKEVYLYAPLDLEKNKEFLVYRDRITHEQFELGEDDVILTEKIARELGAEKGDVISVETKEKTYKELKVTEICENYLEHYLYISPKTYKELYGKPVKSNNIYLKMRESDEKNLREIGERIIDERAALSVAYTNNMQSELDDMLKALDVVIVVLIISAGLLAFVVLYNLNNINITERKRELATIKVLGFYDGEVAAYVFRENILLTIIGVAVGVVLGSLLHRYVIVTVEIDNVMFGRIVNTVSFVISALMTCVFSALVNGVMYFKLKKIDMVESLKSVE